MKPLMLPMAMSLATSTVMSASLIQARKDLTPVTVQGNAFFKGNDRFYIRGVDYQPGGSSNLTDPIADAETCKRDIPKFKELGLNTIRVYSIDNSQDHSECMDALASAGIYLILDVNTPKYAINRDDPEGSYNAAYLQFIFATVDEFAQYTNTLAFFSGNEVVNDGPSSKSAPYVKAVTRDVRKYLRQRNLRKVPVGYSAADVESNRFQMAEYMNCGPDDVRSDLFAFNDYSWCDPSSYTQSGWDQKVKLFSSYGIPLFLSEYGCNKHQRSFQEVHALYSEQMTPVYSGGLVYEYTQQANNYGLVEVQNATSVEELPDFNALAQAFADTDNPTGDGGYNKTGGASTCPARDAPNWNVNSSAPLPVMPVGAAKYMKEGAGKGPGFSGPGSMKSSSDAPSATASGTPTATESSSASTSTSSSAKSQTSSAAAGLVVPSINMLPVVAVLATALSGVLGASLILV